MAIIARQRSLFAKTLFLRSRPLFSPSLWKDALADAPRVGAAAAAFFEERAANFASRVSGAHKAELLGVVVLILLSVPLSMAFARRVLTRAQGVAAPAKLKQAVAAAWVALATSAAPLAAVMALTSALEGFDLVDAAMEPILVRLFEGVGRVGVTYGVARALLAPGAPRWRLVDPGDPLAGQLTRLAVAVVATMAVVRLLEQIEETVQAGLSVAILTRGFGALACAALVVATLRNFPRGRAGEANVGRDWLSLDAIARLRGRGDGRRRLRAGLCHLRQFLHRSKLLDPRRRRRALDRSDAIARRHRQGLGADRTVRTGGVEHARGRAPIAAAARGAALGRADAGLFRNSGAAHSRAIRRRVRRFSLRPAIVVFGGQNRRRHHLAVDRVRGARSLRDHARRVAWPAALARRHLAAVDAARHGAAQFDRRQRRLRRLHTGGLRRDGASRHRLRKAGHRRRRAVGRHRLRASVDRQ